VLTLADLSADWCQRVRARLPIADVPLSANDSSAEAGHLGTVCDVDFANAVVFVDFGMGAIACDPSELEITATTVRGAA
jgi:hypothetical protein